MVIVKNDIGGNITRLDYKYSFDPSKYVDLYTMFQEVQNKTAKGSSSCKNELLRLMSHERPPQNRDSGARPQVRRAAPVLYRYGTITTSRARAFCTSEPRFWRPSSSSPLRERSDQPKSSHLHFSRCVWVVDGRGVEYSAGNATYTILPVR
ncbi:hypothetical protein QYE76_068331 [Lolium multiflorum]|uniref:Glycolipid transfer protein domain-containing protein n=1 Tax=Lolium multiflorum TaxID=4521 RepID=A0AAD8SE71_LOLMU|nr:hypothetical protein QYE76_068331 [Lolium multiflorum]